MTPGCWLCVHESWSWYGGCWPYRVGVSTRELFCGEFRPDMAGRGATDTWSRQGVWLSAPCMCRLSKRQHCARGVLSSAWRTVAAKVLMCSFRVSKEAVLDDMFTSAMMQTPFCKLFSKEFYEFYALSESLSCYRQALLIKRQGSMKILSDSQFTTWFASSSPPILNYPISFQNRRRRLKDLFVIIPQL